MSRYFKEAAAAAQAAAPESNEIRLFLARLLEDPDRCVDRIWEGYLVKGKKTGAPRGKISSRASYACLWRQ